MGNGFDMTRPGASNVAANDFGAAGSVVPGSVWVPGSAEAGTVQGSSVAWSSVATYRVMLVTLVKQLKVTRTAVSIGTPTASSSGAAGIYDLTGKLLIDSGPYDLSLAAGLYGHNILNGPVTLAPGEYFFAHACNLGAPVITLSIITASLGALYNGFTTKMGTVANAYNGLTLAANINVGAISPLAYSAGAIMFQT